MEQARAVADGKDILLAGGVSIAREGLAAGLVDEVVLACGFSDGRLLEAAARRS